MIAKGKWMLGRCWTIIGKMVVVFHKLINMRVNVRKGLFPLCLIKVVIVLFYWRSWSLWAALCLLLIIDIIDISTHAWLSKVLIVDRAPDGPPHLCVTKISTLVGILLLANHLLHLVLKSLPLILFFSLCCSIRCYCLLKGKCIWSPLEYLVFSCMGPIHHFLLQQFGVSHLAPL
jgi:hypothetical protein